MSGGGDADTVGSLLAAIATPLSDALRMLLFADKRQWGPDEFEQIRALEDALDDAKKDFQEMAPLVNGQFYYENDRRPDSIGELRALRTKFEFHTQNFKDWTRQGGPINPIWARETAELKQELHRAQCRAARRIFTASHEENRCLGAFQVYRQQRRNEQERRRRRRQVREGDIPPWQQQDYREVGERAAAAAQADSRRSGDLLPSLLPGDGNDPRNAGRQRSNSLEELVPCCNAVGRFERFGEHDVAFVCDFCDGFIVWTDLQNMSASRTQTLPPGSGNNTAAGEGSTEGTAAAAYPHWQAAGLSTTTNEEKTIVYAPLAIANHIAPQPGEWQARITCPYCDEYTYFDQGEDSEEDVKYAQDEKGFEDLQAFQEHLGWYHTALPIPVPTIPIPPISKILPTSSTSTSNCRVM
ncbi:hypothetical protein QBC46DRAFT_372575 [Diplogelasinospora grovesii]|uniref:Uncharacterized protein n=1 Tax=Diplogelasinospora grovesii TaxID=303347 RepID=A0AAN6S8J4_9PEZI|nr:hypothetical protein QBC46DRAFT_372575 [Diplogelasinospora grovesii]